jgi:hypothetical protein
MSTQETAPAEGSQDGTGAGDHDQPYRFGRRPRANAPFPFSTAQFVRMLLLRSCIQAGLTAPDDVRGE